MKRLALCGALALLLAGCGEAPSRDAPAVRSQPRALADGQWRITTIDGAAITNARMAIAIRRGAIAGGHDGCNAWGFEVLENGERAVVANQMACPDTPELMAYRPLTNTDPSAVTLRMENNMLIAETSGHRFVARR